MRRGFRFPVAPCPGVPIPMDGPPLRDSTARLDGGFNRSVVFDFFRRYKSTCTASRRLASRMTFVAVPVFLFALCLGGECPYQVGTTGPSLAAHAVVCSAIRGDHSSAA